MRSFTAFRKTSGIILCVAWPEKSCTLARLFWPSARVHFLACHSERSEESQQFRRKSYCYCLGFSPLHMNPKKIGSRRFHACPGGGTPIPPSIVLRRWRQGKLLAPPHEPKKKSALADSMLVRVEGLEPPCLAASDPKSDMSTNFTTPGLKRYFSFEGREYSTFFDYQKRFFSFLSSLSFFLLLCNT